MINTNYPVGDFLIKVKNTAMAKNKTFSTVSNKYVESVAGALKKLGFLDEVKKDGKTISVSLTFKSKQPRLVDIKLVSKPGLRVYIGASELEKIKRPSIYLLSTPKGIISTRQAVKDRVGGEIIAEIW